ncbi:MAG: hypothetical protein ACREEE_13210 [Dongiaceae bacterium]
MPTSSYPVYMGVVWVGTVIGAIGLGSLNLSLAGMPGFGRSIIGALAGGIVAAEFYKFLQGVRGSTGIVFVVLLAVAMAITTGPMFGGPFILVGALVWWGGKALRK